MNNKQKILIIASALIILLAGISAYNLSKDQNAQQKESGTPSNSQPLEQASSTTTSSVNASTSSTGKNTPAVNNDGGSAATSVQNSSSQTKPKTVTASTVKAPYINTAAGYSIEIPDNWFVTVNTFIYDLNEKETTGVYLGVYGMSEAEQDFTFDLHSATTKKHTEVYESRFGKVPTYNDMFNGLLETQKLVENKFELQNSKKVTINGREVYEANALTDGGERIQRLYAIYTPKNSYLIRISSAKEKWSAIEPELTKIVNSFTVK